MIDNSTRKFVNEGRNPPPSGSPSRPGHSTVVSSPGSLVITGAGFVRVALDETSGAARVLGIVGLSVSGLYLLLVAVANLATFLQALRLRRALPGRSGPRRPPHALEPTRPGGPDDDRPAAPGPPPAAHLRDRAACSRWASTPAARSVC